MLRKKVIMSWCSDNQILKLGDRKVHKRYQTLHGLQAEHLRLRLSAPVPGFLSVYSKPIYWLLKFSNLFKWLECFLLFINSFMLISAMDVVGGAAEGAVGWRVRWVGGGRAGSDQALRAAAADHAAVHCQCHQRGRGAHSAAQVQKCSGNWSLKAGMRRHLLKSYHRSVEFSILIGW